MPIMTDEEADALDEELTRTVPKLTNIEGPFIQNCRQSMLVALDQLSAQYLQARMLATKQTPTELISELVRERIAAVRQQN
ncbi:MAG TPA: hypothetical protein DEQ14_10505 [Treponema sp.]|nr:hypothetical protein [Treponema sp.]